MAVYFKSNSTEKILICVCPYHGANKYLQVFMIANSLYEREKGLPSITLAAQNEDKGVRREKHPVNQISAKINFL